MDPQETTPQATTEGQLDLGEIEPGEAAAIKPSPPGIHPWSQSWLDKQ